MGYDLHITRKEFWADEDGPEITHEEWNAYVAADPELTQDPINSETDYLYTQGEDVWPLWWSDGEISTKNPEKSMVIKFVAIAESLGARAQGDDGEYYDQHGEMIPEEQPEEAPTPSETKKPWWKFW